MRWRQGPGYGTQLFLLTLSYVVVKCMCRSTYFRTVYRKNIFSVKYRGKPPIHIGLLHSFIICYAYIYKIYNNKISVRLLSTSLRPTFFHTAHIIKTVKAKFIRIRETKWKNCWFCCHTWGFESKRFLFLFCRLKEKHRDFDDIDYVNFIHFIVTMLMKYIYSRLWCHIFKLTVY
jgi:hypothetical protein